MATVIAPDKTYTEAYNWFMAEYANAYDYEMLCEAAANYASRVFWEMVIGSNVPANNVIRDNLDQN